MKDAKELPVPKWNVWITFVIFVLMAIGCTGFIIYNLRNVLYVPGIILGNTLAAIIMLYFLVLVPSIIMWEYLRK